MDKYIVLHGVLDTKMVQGSLKNVPVLEKTINTQASKGYKLHTLTTVSANSTGLIREGSKVQVIMVFEKI